MEYADLEISLVAHETARYRAELRFSLPGSDADTRPTETPIVQFDFGALRAAAYDPVQYGQLLGASLLQAEAGAFIAQARTSAQTANVPLRIRLRLDPRDHELHRLHWETLRDPQTDTPLFTGETVLFSRYLSSLDWRPVRLRSRGALRVLAVAANPTGLEQYRLAPVDVAGELERVQASFTNATLTTLPTAERKASLQNLTAQLRAGCDVLYLVAHGALIKDKPMLWLEKEEDESGGPLDATELVTRIRELEHPPQLIVLASCQSAATGNGAALVALGPRLAEAGVPAVVAMQGNVSMDTVKGWLPVFMTELQQHGQIDRALAVARGGVRQRPDHWMPALFMRLKSGRLWYTPGFADDPNGLKKWPALLSNLQDNLCTPLLGPSLLEVVFGPRQEMAWRWAQEHHYPLSPHEREDLSHVAQFLAIEQDAMYPRAQYQNFLRQALRERYGALVNDAALGLPEAVSIVGQQLRAQNIYEPHQVLASLPIPLYLTANPDNLLYDALVAAGKKPRIHICQWNAATKRLPAPANDPAYQPTAQEPLIFYLFGSLQQPRSLVITEDDYLDYVIYVHRNNTLPALVRDALASTALLFFGFQPSDWQFRVIFRTIRNQEGSSQLDDYAHVTAQIDPEEGRILEPRRARSYFESYFQKANTSLFWGTVEDFAAQLGQKWGKK